MPMSWEGSMASAPTGGALGSLLPEICCTGWSSNDPEWQQSAIMVNLTVGGSGARIVRRSSSHMRFMSVGQMASSLRSASPPPWSAICTHKRQPQERSDPGSAKSRSKDVLPGARSNTSFAICRYIAGIDRRSLRCSPGLTLPLDMPLRAIRLAILDRHAESRWISSRNVQKLHA
jgi:hypothetical protein